MALTPLYTLVSSSFTRPANTTAYTAGDVVCDNTTAGSVTPLSFTIETGKGRGLILKTVKLETDNTTATNADFSIHLYESSPTLANGDNGAWSTTESNYLGEYTLDSCVAFTDAIASVTVLNHGVELHWRLATATTIYGLLEAQGAYTPASGEVFTVTLIWEHYA